MKIRLASTETENRWHHYTSLLDCEDIDWQGTIVPPFDESKLSSLDALILSCEFHLPTRLAIAACHRQNIPTFHVMDGILEWRNLFENPRTMDKENGAPLYRPLISDITFAMGEIQKGTLEWLGNSSVIASGLPRLDTLRQSKCRVGPPEKERPAKLLIATANTPWFTDSQKEAFLPELGKLVSLLKTLGESCTPFQTTWRVADTVAKDLQIKNETKTSATEALQGCDALITSPSSLAVEAMVLGIPTLIFDPYACPVLTPSAWAATSATSVIDLLPSLLSPTRERASLQDTLSGRIACCDGRATDRIRDTLIRVVQENQSPAEVTEYHNQSLATSPSAAPHTTEQSLSTLEGLAATIPALEHRLTEQQSVIDSLHHERANPSVKHALGRLYRSLTRGNRR